MRDFNRPKTTARDAFNRGADIFATIAGCYLTFIFAPQLYYSTINFAQSYAAAQFGPGWEGFVSLAWMLGCAIGTFGLSIMLISITLRLGAAKLAGMIFGE